MWQLDVHKIDGDGWETIGTFDSVTAAALFIRSLEGPAPKGQLFNFGIDLDAKYKSDYLEHQGRKGSYALAWVTL